MHIFTRTASSIRLLVFQVEKEKKIILIEIFVMKDKYFLYRFRTLIANHIRTPHLDIFRYMHNFFPFMHIFECRSLAADSEITTTFSLSSKQK